MRLVYIELPAQDSSAARCSVLLENRVQCPERASYRLIESSNDSESKLNKETDLCKHHLQVEIELAKQFDDTIEVRAINPQNNVTYQPPQI